MADLGAALRRAGQRAESREILRPALDLAHRCGALALTERTRTELIAAGGRPRRLVLSGLDSLTPSERRVAQLAAAGLSNREIAQHLFITARTVEGHLTHAYQKLAITSREQLPAALATPDVETTAPPRHWAERHRPVALQKPLRERSPQPRDVRSPSSRRVPRRWSRRSPARHGNRDFAFATLHASPRLRRRRPLGTCCRRLELRPARSRLLRRCERAEHGRRRTRRPFVRGASLGAAACAQACRALR